MHMSLKLAELFGDNMVLQQGKKVNIWGSGTPNQIVTVRVQDKSCQTRVAEGGQWRVEVPELKASKQETLTVHSGDEEIILKNVAIGEVWLAGGQSNMEFFMRYDKDFNETVKHCENSDIRFFDYPEVPAERFRDTKDYSEYGFWRLCNEENIQYYSAVAYYFARDLQKALDVPVGIVACNCGGTRACCWMDEASVQKYGPIWQEEYEAGVAAIKDLKAAEEVYANNPMCDKAHPFDNEFTDRLLYGLSEEEMLAQLAQLAPNGDMSEMNPIGPWHEWRPSGLYHTMLKHVAPYTIRGVIWYQGESDDIHADIYEGMMEGVIRCWRKEWNDELPFIMTQLAPLGEALPPGGRYYPLIRDAQEAVVKKLPQVYCASIGDVGSGHDIHPKEKQPVGHRMALLARGHVYGENILCEAPMLEDAVYADGQIDLSFSNAEEGLLLKNHEDQMKSSDSLSANKAQGSAHVNALTVYVSDHVVNEALYDVTLKDNHMLITFKSVQPTAGTIKISFARTSYYEVNVYNVADIPMKPFFVEV